MKTLVALLLSLLLIVAIVYAENALPDDASTDSRDLSLGEGERGARNFGKDKDKEGGGGYGGYGGGYPPYPPPYPYPPYPYPYPYGGYPYGAPYYG